MDQELNDQIMTVLKLLDNQKITVYEAGEEIARLMEKEVKKWIS